VSREGERVAIVTGGGRGIGRAVALVLGTIGHAVCVNDTGVDLRGNDASAEPSEEISAAIRHEGARSMASVIDARHPVAARRLVAEVEEWAGQPPTLLVHAAGTLRDGMVHKVSDDDWAEVMGAHLDVAAHVTRAMAPALRAANFGRIVYLGGAAGLVGSVGQAAYDVAKAGLFGLTRACALEMASHNVCVNYVAPFAFTRLTQAIPPATEQLRNYLASAPLATPEDIAPLVTWLCSDAAAGISGQVFGARGAEVSIWSQPRPMARAVNRTGWAPPGLTTEALPKLEAHLTPLESEFDLFADPPTPVMADDP
jgi:NAD(P)-dependent dehydrogenase (short-subunit alcohol dehydrogenase family)